MQEKKREMASSNGDSSSSSNNKNPKKANLMDPHSIKNLLDESVTEIVTSRGYVEDVRMSNIRLFMGAIIIIIALVAQFYPKKFPENRDFLIGCIFLYIALNGLLQLITYSKEKNAILFTYPLPGSFSSTGLVVSSKLPRFSDIYTLSIASADPKSLSAKKPVQFTKSVTQWFTKDGVLVEGLFSKDVDGLINQYTGESRKNK
ncbi:probable signal peptidase complex subunit 2 [Macadamia integrifolia]|uniref:probable signal peptidase complex subunit 2 n=1 Tax=Macadamia integrifolia TaxID=60698 RepID=UPI001C4F8659|nr:probable signal peptidase complex subunit 2 [Macadamia integrifolia]